MFSVFVHVSVSGDGEGRGSGCVNAVDHSDGEARASDFAPAMAVSVPARCMSHGARARQQAACVDVFGCKRGGHVTAAAAAASRSIMFSSACCGRFPRRSSTGVRRSTFKLPPAAACSPSLAAVWHVSCILGKVGTVQRLQLQALAGAYRPPPLTIQPQTCTKATTHPLKQSPQKQKRNRNSAAPWPLGLCAAAELRLVSIRFKRFVQVP